MGFSIQDYLKKINSRLTFIDIFSIFATCMILFALALYLHIRERENWKELVYKPGVDDSSYVSDDSVMTNIKDSRAFGSSKGKTYTFSWCQGASRISPKNKVYFSTEDEAKKTGRIL